MVQIFGRSFEMDWILSHTSFILQWIMSFRWNPHKYRFSTLLLDMSCMWSISHNCQRDHMHALFRERNPKHWFYTVYSNWRRISVNVKFNCLASINIIINWSSNDDLYNHHFCSSCSNTSHQSFVKRIELFSSVRNLLLSFMRMAISSQTLFFNLFVNSIRRQFELDDLPGCTLDENKSSSKNF